MFVFCVCVECVFLRLSFQAAIFYFHDRSPLCSVLGIFKHLQEHLGSCRSINSRQLALGREASGTFCQLTKGLTCRNEKHYRRMEDKLGTECFPPCP